MSNFERIYQIDPQREKGHQREMHPSIELSDEEYLERQQPKVSKDMEEAKFVYKPPVMDEESMSPALKEKFKKARKLCQDTKVVTLPPVEPPPIAMNLEMPELEKAIKKGKKNAKDKSKSPKSKSKKNSTKSNSAAVASVQEKL